jgi:two-component system response regulator TtrR
VILDIHMPEMSGLELQKHMIAKQCQIPVIILSGRATIKDAVTAFKQGTFEFLEKPYESARLLERIAQALESLRARRESRKAIDELRQRMQSLTDRQKGILRLTVAGWPSKTIGDRYAISTSTVDNHRARIMKKLGAKSMAELIRFSLIALEGEDPSTAAP